MDLQVAKKTLELGEKGERSEVVPEEIPTALYRQFLRRLPVCRGDIHRICLLGAQFRAGDSLRLCKRGARYLCANRCDNY